MFLVVSEIRAIVIKQMFPAAALLTSMGQDTLDEDVRRNC